MSTFNSDSLLRRLQIHQRLTPTIILHYDPQSHDLQVWFWPVTQAGTRVPPSDLLDYRIDHEFRAPCCLCASNANGVGFTESAIYLAICGPYKDEYVAGCASDECGYLVCLERLYPKRGLILRKYPVRPLGTRANGQVPYIPMQAANPPVLSQLRRSGGNSGGLFASIATYQRPVKGPESALDRLLRLDSWIRPGLSGPEFNRLFARCNCGLIMTRRVFRNHICAAAPAVARNPPAIIDLTADNDGSDDFANRDPSRMIIDLTADSDEDGS